jgi:hypothetical protein
MSLSNVYQELKVIADQRAFHAACDVAKTHYLAGS